MNLDSLKKLYVHELKDLYSAENQLLESVPTLIEAAGDEELTTALENQLDRTKTQIQRLEKIFGALDFSPRGHRCRGMEGLLTETREVLSDVEDPEVRDAAVAATVQRLAHYQIAGYGTARAYAEKLGQYEAADLLRESLDEEGAADREMSRLAERRLNFEASVA